mmetsp:Transcript_2124/g.5259  ORF Transcript_2124/g.5259 Transcript_2124/m.5259 type:complete len:580 (-) Transcript_2124:2222-3961(-)
MEGEVRLLDPNEDLTLEDMGTGRVELLLKCTSGLYKGRFLYINTSPEGESFGSDLAADAGLTTYIEQAGLSLRHAEIKFHVETSTYILKDCGSSTGTWVKLSPAEASGVEVESGSAFLIGSSLLEFSRGEVFDEVAEVVDMFHLNDLAGSLDNFDNIAYISLESAPPEDRNRLSNAQQMIRTSTFPEHYLNVSFLSDRKKVGLHPLKIGSASDSDIRISGVDQYVGDISFKYGHFVFSQENDVKVAIFKRLGHDEPYNLQPGNVFRIGHLEFETCRFNVGRWSEKGARTSLEDTDISVQNLFVYEDIPVSFFGVYDGHGGAACSEYLKSNLHNFMRNQIISHPHKASSVNRALYEGISEAYKACDLAFFNQYPTEANSQGATAVVCLIIGDRIITCNLGDSKAVLSRNGRAIELSVDHKPDLATEKERITQKGGFVAFGRLCGRLAVSRSFGDFNYKAVGERRTIENTESLMSSVPEIKEVYINPQEDEFLLLACDGMFEAFTPQGVVSLIREKLARMQSTEQDPNRVIREVVNEAVYSRRTRDNVSAILVTLSCGIAVDTGRYSDDLPTRVNGTGVKV